VHGRKFLPLLCRFTPVRLRANVASVRAHFVMAAAVGIASGCASAQNATVRSQGESVPAGDLPAGVPGATSATSRGETGVLSRVVLGARRERVVDLYRQYLRAVMARDLEAMRPLFHEYVQVQLHRGEPSIESRENVLRAHENMFSDRDLPTLEHAANNVVSLVHSAQEAQRSPPMGFAGMSLNREEWVLTGPAMGSSRGRSMVEQHVPRFFIVRWEGDSPVIVRIQWPLQR
jgi:hypothetical protein